MGTDSLAVETGVKAGSVVIAEDIVPLKALLKSLQMEEEN